MSSNNPSALQQARKAQADEVMALRNKCTGLEETVETLQEDVEKVLRDNRTLRSETNKVLTAYNDLCSRFDKSQKELHSLQEFQTRATKLLMALSSGQNVDKIRSDILAAALASRDPGAHLRALVDDDQGSNREDQEDDQPDGAEPRSHQVITGAEQAGAQGIQEELRDSAVMLVSQRFPDKYNDKYTHSLMNLRMLSPKRSASYMGLRPVSNRSKCITHTGSSLKMWNGHQQAKAMHAFHISVLTGRRNTTMPSTFRSSTDGGNTYGVGGQSWYRTPGTFSIKPWTVLFRPDASSNTRTKRTSIGNT